MSFFQIDQQTKLGDFAGWKIMQNEQINILQDDYQHLTHQVHQDLFNDLSLNSNHILSHLAHPISTTQPAKHSKGHVLDRQDQGQGILDESSENIKQKPLFRKIAESFRQEEESQSFILKTQKTRMRNDTKNIPKNFGKGIINFIQKNEKKMRAMVVFNGLTYSEFMRCIKAQKKTINTIADLRRLWTDQKFGKCMRMISNLFFRKYAIEYIFNSRISSYSTHIKYRHILWQALKDPLNFNHIKEY